MKIDTQTQNNSKKVTKGLHAVRKKKLYEEIVVQIKELISKGELKPGDKLPTERELVEVFQVSRHCIREAIRSLEEKKNVVTKPGSGTFVMSSDGESIVEYLATTVLYEKDRLAEIFTFRRMLEPQIAAMAAENVCEEDLKKFEEILSRQKRKNIKPKEYMKLDDEFHLLIASATKNLVLQRVIKGINGILMECRSETFQSTERMRLSLEGHLLIFEAIKNRDSTQAALYTNQHLDFIEDAIMKMVNKKT